MPVTDDEKPTLDQLLSGHALRAQDMFADMFDRMSQLSATVSDGTGAVTVTMTSRGLHEIRIDRGIVQPQNADILADLVHRALANAAQELNRQAELQWPQDGGPESLLH